jgi:hypothetical protein
MNMKMCIVSMPYDMWTDYFFKRLHLITKSTQFGRPVLGLTQSPIRWVLGASSLDLQWQGCEVDHASLSVDVKNGGGVPSLPDISSWHSA